MMCTRNALAHITTGKPFNNLHGGSNNNDNNVNNLDNINNDVNNYNDSDSVKDNVIFDYNATRNKMSQMFARTQNELDNYIQESRHQNEQLNTTKVTDNDTRETYDVEEHNKSHNNHY